MSGEDDIFTLEMFWFFAGQVLCQSIQFQRKLRGNYANSSEWDRSS